MYGVISTQGSLFLTPFPFKFLNGPTTVSDPKTVSDTGQSQFPRRKLWDPAPSRWSHLQAEGYVVPEGGGVDGKEDGDFFNKAQLFIGSPGDDQATFECRGAFNQEFAGALTVVDGFAVFASSTGTYNISGSPVAGRVFALNRRDYKIHVASPATGTECPFEAVPLKLSPSDYLPAPLNYFLTIELSH